MTHDDQTSLDPFCDRYDLWKNEGFVLAERKHSYVIPSVTPTVPGHLLTVTRRHVVHPSELTDEEALDFFQVQNEAFETLKGMYRDESGAFDSSKMTAMYAMLISHAVSDRSERMLRQMMGHRYLHIPPVAYNIGMNVGEDAGQMVGHLHTHLIPRRGIGRRGGVGTAFRVFFD